MAAEAEGNKKVGNDQNVGGSDAPKDASAKILEDNRKDSKSTSSDSDKKDKDNDQQSSGGKAFDSGSGSIGRAADAGGVDSGSSDGNGVDRMRSEAEATMKSQQEMAKFMKVAALSAETAAKFGTPELFDSAASGKMDAAMSEAVKVNAEKAQERVESKLDGTIIDDSSKSGIGDPNAWNARTFDKTVSDADKQVLSPLFESFGEGSDWQFNSFTGSSAAADSIAGLNDVSKREFGQKSRDVMARTKFDANEVKADGIKIPENATEDGSLEMSGEKVTVMRTPEGDTFLKKGDKAFAERDKDGKFKMMMEDGTRVEAQLSKDESGYKLDHMERFKGDQLQQKYHDGVNFAYNYDAQGNRTSVDAAADFKDNLTPQQLQQKMDGIRSELGPNGEASIRFKGENGETQRRLLQTHGADTHSITNIDNRTAQIFHKGKEFTLDRNDRLGVAKNADAPSGSDAKVPTDPASAEPAKVDEPAKSDADKVAADKAAADKAAADKAEADKAAAEKAEEPVDPRLAELKKEIDARAQGVPGAAVDGVSLEIDENGDAKVTRTDVQTGEKVSETKLPADSNDPVSMKNEKTGETTTIDGDKFQTVNEAGDKVLDFDPSTGLEAGDFQLNEDGLHDLENGMNLDENGNVFDGEGSFISGDFDGEDSLLEEYSAEEHVEHQALSKEASSTVSALGSQAFSISRSGDPHQVGVAKTIAAGAINVAGQAISALGNDVRAQMPVLDAKSLAEGAYDQASRQERTQTYAMKMGIFDTTRLSEFNRIGTLSSTAFSPEEFVRSRMKNS